MLPNSTIVKGRYAEGAVRRKLELQGFTWTIRSYASHGPIDLLASNGSDLWAVQVKSARRNGGYLSAENIQLLIEWASKFHAKPVLAYKKNAKWVFKQLSEVDPSNLEFSLFDELGDDGGFD